MRRADIETIEVSAWGDKLASRIARGEIDPDFVIRVLEEYATQRRRERLQEVFRNRLGSVTVVMDEISDPHNGAALVRTCEAFGVGIIHLIAQGSQFLAHAGVARGTHKWVEVKSHDSVVACVGALKAEGMTLVGAHPSGDMVAADLNTIDRVAIVLGNEHAGIESSLYEACDHAVRVPMRGFAESLNVSVSGAILLAYAVAGRPGDLPELQRKRLYARGLAVTVPHASSILDRAARQAPCTKA
ncbi:MAG: hypothetical protein CSA75_00060 [Sorangium cellulosum]|nr:MAG: hypothetical protein CSA75_00060 [Sorangium cellulosum]